MMRKLQRPGKRHNFANAGAAPHLPAGIFSPWNGEKGAVAGVSPIANVARKAPRLRTAPSPRHYTGRSARQGDEGQRRPWRSASLLQAGPRPA
ncbi:hypothetical protein MPL3356_220085 [Mesorhizobium plurifarium]|uniref:Uncharacterized protein n=1 Tax=Mesorhizobium plurifarium TaxID=69974 RepID=A0A090DK33_MESPL|nr:hypothetical protein MPL3356_220085 [Mesorhizobium plurifarium]